MTRRLFAAGLLVAFSTFATAQTPVVFDVVSIKPNNSGSLQRDFNDAEGGHFVATNVALGDLVRVSHEVRPAGQAYSDLMNGGVGWLYTDHFDIRATTATQPSRQQLLAMIRAMLVDRFHLRVHSIARDETVFELRRVREDQLGPRLKPADVACSGPSAACSLTNTPGKIAATSIPMETLAHMLGGWVDGHYEVRDGTGLQGAFSIELTWTPTEQLHLPDTPPPDPAGPALGTALREQLGLRLVAAKLEVPLLVVDSADKPSPD